MKINYIKCMDFIFENVELPEYNNTNEIKKAIEKSKVIKIVSDEDRLIDYVNSNYIMYFGNNESEE